MLDIDVPGIPKGRCIHNGTGKFKARMLNIDTLRLRGRPVRGPVLDLRLRVWAPALAPSSPVHAPSLAVRARLRRLHSCFHSPRARAYIPRARAFVGSGSSAGCCAAVALSQVLNITFALPLPWMLKTGITGTPLVVGASERRYGREVHSSQIVPMDEGRTTASAVF